MTKPISLKKVLKNAGGAAALAASLGVTVQAISGWRKKGVIPQGRVIEVEKACRGLVTREQMRPDLYPVARS